MKHKQTALRLSVALDNYELALLDKAGSKLMGLYNHPDLGERIRRRDLRRMIQIAICAFTRAVIIQGWKDNVMAMAQLRPETKQELEDRINDTLPNGPGEKSVAWTVPNRWN